MTTKQTRRSVHCFWKGIGIERSLFLGVSGGAGLLFSMTLRFCQSYFHVHQDPS